MTDDSFNLNELLGKALERWYLFALALLAALVIAYFYLQTSPRLYESAAFLLIKDEKKSGEVIEEAIFSDLGLSGNRGNLENEILTLKSSPLMREVVLELNLQYEYLLKGQFRNFPLYNESPVNILNWVPVDTNEVFEGVIIERNNSGGYVLETEEKTYKGEFGTVLKMPEGDLTLSRGISQDQGQEIIIKAWPIDAIVFHFLSNLNVEPEGVESSIIKLNLVDESPFRAKDVLEKLISTYNVASIDEKNRVFKNSIDLINDRINVINRELSSAEANVESFQSRFNAMDLSSLGSELMNEASDYDRKISDSEVQLEILNSVEGFLDANKNNFEFVPTNSALNNLTLSNQLTKFNDLLQERGRLRNDLGPAHPDLILVEKQIQNLRRTIIQNVKAIKSDIQIVRGSDQSKKNNIEGRIRSLPRRERVLIQLERDKGVKENLYLYLLQKREESAVSLAVTVAKGKVIEPPKPNVTPISPRKKFIWAIASFIGLVIPSGLLYLLIILDTKVRTENDIRRLTSVPVGGIIARNRDKKTDRIVIKEGANTAVSETFRLLRANLAYISPGKEIQKILVTSSMSGEGKSFIALNLAMTQALSNKKTIILELDLRKPKQSEYIKIKDIKSVKGIVNYLVNSELTAEDIICKSGLHENLDIITCGPKPPNPGELILSNRLRKLVTELEQSYDFIIIDAPPVGLVSDPLQLSDLVESTIYVVRAGHTRNNQLEIIQDIADKKKLPNPFIVFNFVNLNKTGNRYGYGTNNYYDT